MVDLGYNYRLSDIQCALGITQLAKLPQSIARRQAIAAPVRRRLRRAARRPSLGGAQGRLARLSPLRVQLELERLRVDRGQVFRALRAEGIGVNVHYRPVHLHPYYRNHFGTKPGDCPVAEAAYERILSLPMFPAMTEDGDVEDVIEAMRKIIVEFYVC